MKKRSNTRPATKVTHTARKPVQSKHVKSGTGAKKVDLHHDTEGDHISQTARIEKE
jgi:hypothetical protein